ncbi:MAG: hypothetical protein KDJ65_21800 [Anaerolineae bacterium]|nr:hypothetical protein [Anaerolineae bacterium]
MAVDERDLSRIKAFRQAADQLHQYLSVQFPQFQWDMPFIHRALFSPHGALDPLPLLEAGMHEKTSHVWDYALVVVPNELTPLERIFTIGVPSSALEVAALSSARLNYGDRFSEQLSALATHLLGHMWGLEHAETGPMVPPEDCDTLTLDDFSESEQEIIIDRLEEVADQRLEEQQSRWSWLSFYWHTFWADPQSIFIDVLGYKPWRLPIRMGRLTAAALASILVLVLAAESWEIGTNLYFPTLVVATVLSIFIATILLFFGQNLNNIAREVGWREQLTRTRIVLFQTLLVGMITVWGVLFTISFITALFIPRSVTLVWSGLSTLGLPLLAQHAAFMATTGVLAAALGGNLEEEDTLKAKLFFDEET